MKSRSMGGEAGIVPAAGVGPVAAGVGGGVGVAVGTRAGIDADEYGEDGAAEYGVGAVAAAAA